METKNLQIRVPTTFPLTADYSFDWIGEQLKLMVPEVKQFEIQNIKVEFINSALEKTITATCVLYH